MPKPKVNNDLSLILLMCPNCEETGYTADGTCPVCSGVPELGEIAVRILCLRFDAVLAYNVRLNTRLEEQRREIKKLRADQDKIIHGHLQTVKYE